MRKALFILLFFGFVACSSSPVPAGIIPPPKMQPLVADIIQVDEYINNFLLADTSIDLKKKRSIYYEQVFKMHNTTRALFYASFRYYEQHPDMQKSLFDSLNQQFNRKVEEKFKPAPVQRERVKVSS